MIPMPSGLRYEFIDPATIDHALAALARSNSSVDEQLSAYISGLITDPRKRQPHPTALIGYFAVVVSKGRFLSGSMPSPQSALAVRWGVDFIKSILKELRVLICGKSKKLGANSQALLTTVAATIARKTGMPDATSTGLAVFVLISLGRASKNGFCRMTAKEVFEALEKDALAA